MVNLTFNKSGKTIQWGKNSLQQMVLGQLEVHMQNSEFTPLPQAIHKS